MNIPPVKACAACECAYNENKTCHAIAITVGDGAVAHCDTYFKAKLHGGEPAVVGGVGACKVSGCVHNEHLTCHAGSIEVGYLDSEVHCLTYKPAA